jgi:hypothetical protein
MINRLRTLLVALALAVPLLGLGGAPAHAQSFAGDDLASYYPNTALYQTQYLQGRNYVTDPPGSAVLWFVRQDQYTFLQHNGQPGGPQADCNTDYLSWWPDGFLRYVRTINSCGAHTTDIDYFTQNDPIILLPHFWDGNPWTVSGTSTAVYRIDGTVACTGTNAWTARIYGVEQMAPGELGLHFRTSQTLSLTGSACAPTTHWQEDLWLVQDLPGPNGPQKALKRTQGGNLDAGYPAWNIWMDDWAPLT